MKKYTIIFLSIAVALAPLFLLAAYNHPTDDDYCTYQLFHKRSAAEAFAYGYQNFSGRFTYLLFFSQWDPLYHADWLTMTRLWPVITLAAFLITIRVLMHFTLTTLSSREQWLISGLLSVVMLEGWPSVASSFYWFTGATVYTLAALCAALSLIALHVSIKSAGIGKRITLLVVACALGLAAVGSNEVLITFMLLFILALLVWTKYEASRIPIPTVLFLLVVATGAYIALSAPGNFKRASDMLHRTPNLAYAMKVGIKCAYLVTLKMGSWVSHVPLWLMGLLVAASAGTVSFSWLAPRNRSHLAALAALFYVLVVAMAFLSCYAYNDIIPRVWNLAYFFFVFAFFYLLLFAVRLFPLTEPLISFVRNQWSAFALATVMLCMVSSGSNLTIAWNDLLFKAKEYDAALVRRYELLRSAKADGKQNVVVEPLFLHRYEYPGTLFLNDLSMEPNEFPNTCLGYFFGLDSMRLSCCPQESRHLE